MRILRQTAVQMWVLTFALTTSAAVIDVSVFDALGRQQPIESVLIDVCATRAVFIGENHDRYDQHLSELEVIRRLYERDPDRWAIGVEFIQRPFQRDLDAYIAGEISEREFLRKTEYFDRWGFDFRLYRPIFDFAREHRIPMVALNADRELSEKVGKVGLEGLTPLERDQLPRDIDKSDLRYRERIQDIFKEHALGRSRTFEHFWEAQLVWDETMAESVAGYLSTHPQKAMIVLAGAGHIEFGSGIPNRVRRRLPGIRTALFITNDNPPQEPQATDYSLISEREALPPAPKMGITMEVSEGVRIKSVTPGGPADEKGMNPKDRIVAIDDQDIRSLGDIRLALLDKKPGDPIVAHIMRDDASGKTEDLVFQLKLQ